MASITKSTASPHTRKTMPKPPLKNISKMLQKTKKRRDPRLLGTIAPYPQMDIQEEYMVSVSENGSGVLNKIVYNEPPQQHTSASFSNRVSQRSSYIGRNRSMKSSPPRVMVRNSNRVDFDELNRFSINDEDHDSGDLCFSIEICLEHEVFIIG